MVCAKAGIGNVVETMAWNQIGSIGLLSLAIVGGIFCDLVLRKKVLRATLLGLHSLMGLGALWQVFFAAAQPAEFPQRFHLLLEPFQNEAHTRLAEGLILLAYLLSSVLLYHERAKSHYYYLLSGIGIGALVMVSARSMIALYLGMVCSTLPAYIGCVRQKKETAGVALRYALYGLFSLGIMLYGMSLAYGMSGGDMYRGLMLLGERKSPWVLCIYFCVYVGVFFKLGAVPMHGWVMSVYHTLPLGLLGMISVGVKVAAWIVLLHLAVWWGGALHDIFLGIGILLCALWGGMAALKSDSLRGLLAFSSIAYAGFFALPMIGVKEASEVSGVLGVSLIFYTLAEYVLLGIMRQAEKHDIHHLSDLSQTKSRHGQYIAVCFVLAWIAMGGFPPFLGFLSKWMVLHTLWVRYVASPDVGYMLLLIGGGLSLLLGMCYGLRPAYFFTQRSRKKSLLPASKGYFPLTLWICITGLMALAGLMIGGQFLLKWIEKVLF